MSETSRMLKKIMRSSGWTQEQLAGKLGVSFASMNAWVNGRTKPRLAMMQRIRKLYLAQDITGMNEPVYVTLVNVDLDLKVGDAILLEKDLYNLHDDEAIMASKLSFDEIGGETKSEYIEANGLGMVMEDEISEVEVTDEVDEVADEPDYIEDDLMNDELAGDVLKDEELASEELTNEVKPEGISVMTSGDTYTSEMYVANSVSTVIRGTKSAGRIYDRFKTKARAQVLFIVNKVAIARIVEWDYEE